MVTDSSGQTEVVELNAPPEEWSLDENEERQPYSEYTLNIEAEGFESISVSGTEILANTKAIQNVRMKQKDQSRKKSRYSSSLLILYMEIILRRLQRKRLSQ